MPPGSTSRLKHQTELLRDMAQHVDGVLRAQEELIDPQRPGQTLRRLLGLILLFGMLYGGIMGCFAGRPLQMLYSALKVPLLLLVTFGLSLPSFFVLNTLAGLRGDFAKVLRALAATQAGLTVILASLAPLTLLWYASFPDYESAVAYNTVTFGFASVVAQLLLRRYYRPLIAQNLRHRLMIRIWIVLFAFTGIQMGWVLRPFVGFPGDKTQFLRPESWGNAYLVVGEMFWDLITR